MITILILIDTFKRDDIIQMKLEARNNQPYICIIAPIEEGTVDTVIYHKTKNSDNTNSNLYQVLLKIHNITGKATKNIKFISQVVKLYNYKTKI